MSTQFSERHADFLQFRTRGIFHFVFPVIYFLSSPCILKTRNRWTNPSSQSRRHACSQSARMESPCREFCSCGIIDSALPWKEPLRTLNQLAFHWPQRPATGGKMSRLILVVRLSPGLHGRWHCVQPLTDICKWSERQNGWA